MPLGIFLSPLALDDFPQSSNIRDVHQQQSFPNTVFMYYIENTWQGYLIKIWPIPTLTSFFLDIRAENSQTVQVTWLQNHSIPLFG